MRLLFVVFLFFTFQLVGDVNPSDDESDCPDSVDEAGERYTANHAIALARRLQVAPRDSEAGAALLEHIRAVVRKVSAGQVRDSNTLDDLTSQLFLKVLTIFVRGGRSVPDYFQGWLIRCAVNARTDVVRNAARASDRIRSLVHRRTAMPPPPEDVLSVLTAREDAHVLDRLLVFARRYVGLDMAQEAAVARGDSARERIELHRRILLGHFAGISGRDLAAALGRHEGQVSRVIAARSQTLLERAVAEGVLDTVPVTGRLIFYGLEGTVAETNEYLTQSIP